MRQTVILKLREDDRIKPDMSWEVFGHKMVLEQGFFKTVTLSIQAYNLDFLYNLCLHRYL